MYYLMHPSSGEVWSPDGWRYNTRLIVYETKDQIINDPDRPLYYYVVKILSITADQITSRVIDRHDRRTDK